MTTRKANILAGLLVVVIVGGSILISMVADSTAEAIAIGLLSITAVFLLGFIFVTVRNYLLLGVDHE